VSLAESVAKDMGSKIVAESWLPLTMQTLVFNISRPPWNDLRVREAMYRIINRQQWLDLIWQGKGKIPAGPLSAGLAAYQLDAKQTEKYFRQDQKAARQMLDAAGFPFNKEFDMPLFNRPQDLQGGDIFKQQVAPLGIKVNVRALPAADWLSTVAGQANYDIWFAAHPSYDSPQVPLRLQTTETQNLHKIAGLRDPSVDQLIYKSETIVDPDAQIKAVKDIQLALLDKYTPMIFIDTYNAYALRYSFVQGYEINAGSTPEPMSRTEMWLDK
jgi:peptide/nickel transport system substrate-binding protein